MQADLPHTLLDYKQRRSSEKKIQVRVNPHDPAFAAQQAAYERALAKHKAKIEGRIPYTMQEVFR